MRLTNDESRALGFVALLLALAGLARAVHGPPAVAPDAAPLDLAAHVEASDSVLESVRRRSRPLGPGERIDPNTASAEELDRLPGVGPAVADRIVEERARGGPFRSAADLARVPGIGPKAVERIAPYLSLPPTAPPQAGSPLPRTGATAEDRGGAPPIIDLNRASAAELEALPGIGPALAGRIVAYRDSVGRFRELRELTRVPGIGARTLERLTPFLRLEP